MDGRLWAILATLAGCGGDPLPDAAAEPKRATAIAAAPKGRFDPTMLRAAEQALDNQAWTTFVWFDAGPVVTEWRIGVHGTGQPELGYARLACMVLGGHSVVDAGTRVWMLDDAKARAARGVDVVKRSNLGGVNCETLEPLAA